MTDLTFTFVDAAPADQIEALYQAAGWWEGEPGQTNGIAEMILGSFCFLVAREGDHVVGMGRAISDGASDAWIQDVTVLPTHRHRGIGREIVSRILSRCRAHGIGWIGLVAEKGTHPLYEALGFRAFDGVPMRYMESA